jgi:hypothetical protein
MEHGQTSPRDRRFWLVILGICAVALGLRVAYVVTVTRHDQHVFDQSYYSAMADTLAAGKGFRDPFITDRTVPSADHPPLTAIVAAPASLFFDPPRSRTAQQLLMCLVGTAAVAVIGGAARALLPRYGHVAGYTAAGLAAIAPQLWMNDGLVMSESVGVLTVAGCIWLAVRCLDQPTAWRFVSLGACAGFAILARAEAGLLLPLLVVPIAFTRRGDPDRRPPLAPLRWLSAAALGTVVVVAPWIGPNLVRFNHPTFFSTNDGLTLIGTNCDPAWQGETRGLWMLQCIAAADTNHDGVDDWTAFREGSYRDVPGIDATDYSQAYRSAAWQYFSHHKRQFPAVALNRLGRVWGVTGTKQAVFYNTGEGRPTWASWMGAVSNWIVLPLGLIGMVLLRRNGRPAWPLVAQFVSTSVVAVAFYGLLRFRVGADVALILGTAVLVATLVGRRGGNTSPEMAVA